ncbi:transposase [Myxococcus sp. CA051A]|uniref:transposase n=1 Tax=Myxococcus sp. CA051A TaxID=2741739 RepID=UPI00157A430D|nr:transposase [Myxococcus sp. CA051A]NTX67250.1 transposase [Myxococcus sp. CA051A]
MDHSRATTPVTSRNKPSQLRTQPSPVWDGLNQHHSAETLDFVACHPEDFRLERLPGDAPDLNPEEGCNGVVKAELRNATPDSVAELRAQARASFVRLGHRHDILAAFFQHAGLRLTGLP